jgi:hypothetical protein
MGPFGKDDKAIGKFKLPEHEFLTIRFTLLARDSWEKEHVYIDLDDEKIDERMYDYKDPYAKQICGNGNKDYIDFFSIRVKHNKPIAKLTIRSDLN